MVPLVLRAVYSFALALSLEGRLIRYVRNDDYRYTLFMVSYYGLTDLLPSAAQIISVKLIIKGSAEPNLSDHNASKPDMRLLQEDYMSSEVKSVSASNGTSIIRSNGESLMYNESIFKDTNR